MTATSCRIISGTVGPLGYPAELDQSLSRIVPLEADFTGFAWPISNLTYSSESTIAPVTINSNALTINSDLRRFDSTGSLTAPRSNSVAVNHPARLNDSTTTSLPEGLLADKVLVRRLSERETFELNLYGLKLAVINPGVSSVNVHIGGIEAEFRITDNCESVFSGVATGCWSKCQMCEFKNPDGKPVTDYTRAMIIGGIRSALHELGFSNAALSRLEFTGRGDALYNSDNVIETLQALALHFKTIEVCTSCPGLVTPEYLPEHGDTSDTSIEDPAKLNSARKWERRYDSWIRLLRDHPTIVLRLSLHDTDEKGRDKLMVSDEKTPMLNVSSIAALAKKIRAESGRKVGINYMCLGNKVDDVHMRQLRDLLNPNDVEIYLSPVDQKTPLSHEKACHELERVLLVRDRMVTLGFAVHLRFSAGWNIGQGNGRHVGPKEGETGVHVSVRGQNLKGSF